MLVNMRIRSFITSEFLVSNADRDKLFVQDILLMMQGPFDLGEVQKLRKPRDAVNWIQDQRLRKAASVSLPERRTLADLQVSTKPMSGRRFCLEALAFAWDLGIDLRRPRIQAIGLVLHPRVGEKSPMRVFSSDVLCKIAQASCE